jgi:hypothetical protein
LFSRWNHLISVVPLEIVGDGSFYIAFARRNVPFHEVISAAERVGLTVEIADEDKETSENIYRIYWAA